MMAAVPKATFVIANPTHYAVALRYVREESGAPLVIAKGQDLIALKIREIAEENGDSRGGRQASRKVAVQGVEVDKMIPPEFYKAVAEIILFLIARRRSGTPAVPKRLTMLKQGSDYTLRAREGSG